VTVKLEILWWWKSDLCSFIYIKRQCHADSVLL